MKTRSEKTVIIAKLLTIHVPGMTMMKALDLAYQILEALEG